MVLMYVFPGIALWLPDLCCNIIILYEQFNFNSVNELVVKLKSGEVSRLDLCNAYLEELKV